MTDFSLIPVLHDGRVMPLDSFARIHLRTISGRETIGGESAAGWLAAALFDPAALSDRAAIRVDDPAVRGLLGLGEGKFGHLYSLADILPGLARTESALPTLIQKKDRTKSEEELLAVHDRALALEQILGSLSLALPLGVALPEEIGLTAAPRFSEGYTWLELNAADERIDSAVSVLMRRKGGDMSSLTQEEENLASLGYRMSILGESGRTNALLRIMPPQWAGMGDEWLSPWMTVQAGAGSPEGAEYLRYWQDMARAWRTGDKALWKTVSTRAYEISLAMAGKNVSSIRLRAEFFYNRVKPFTAAMLFYALALGTMFLSGRYRRIARALTIFAMMAHGAGLVLRIFILNRPPVGTLYESLLFVALVVAASAFALSRGSKSTPVLAGGTGTALALLAIAPALAPRGDSLQTLEAVLNTGFWLATHVVCITAAYGVCLLASVLGHLALLRGAAFDRMLHKTSIAALLLTATGTILGGIWADQSWGRFWGWDPKENGALLIVLWLAWLQHGRMAGMLRPTAYAAGMAYLSVIVALSWFGVNLLGVGLHSYGFTQGVAAALFSFCAAQTFLIAVLWRRRTIS